MRAALALLCLGLLAACGPIPVADAERACVEKANLAVQPRGKVGVGVDSRGHTAGTFEVTVSSDYLMGRDPNEVYKSCVKARSGQFPTRPLYDQPGWRG